MMSDNCISETLELFCLEFLLSRLITFYMKGQWIFQFLYMSGMHHLYQPYNAPFPDQSTGATVKHDTCNSLQQMEKEL